MAGVSSVSVSRSAAKLLALNARPAVKVGVLGVFERGAIGRAVECASFQAFQDEFGGYTASAQAAPLAVKTLFEEAKPDQAGGAAPVIVYPVRVVHSSTPANIATKTSVAANVTLQTEAVAPSPATIASSEGPWILADAADLVVAFAAGGDQTFAVQCTAAIKTGSGATYAAVTAGHVLNLTMTNPLTGDAEQRQVVFAGTENSQALFHAAIQAAILGLGTVMNAGGQTRITTNLKGSDAAGTIDASDSDVLTSLGLTASSFSNAGPNNVANANGTGVTAAEWVSMMSAITNGLASDDNGALRLTSTATGLSATVQVKASSTADATMGFSNTQQTGGATAAIDTLQVDAISDGAWANAFSVKVAAPSDGVSGHFNLQVLKGSLIVETYINLSMTDSDQNYVESVINSGVGNQPSSKYIRVTDLDAAAASPDDAPAVGTFDLDGDTAGVDGLTSLADADYVGGLTSAKAAGLSCFDVLADLDIIIAPDRATASFLSSIITYNNSRARPASLILEPPSSQSIAQIRTFVRTTAALIGSTERAAIYYPQTKVDNPDTAIFGNAATVVAPVSGQIAGLYARVAGAKDFGAFTSPAGKPLKLRTARALVNEDIDDPTNRGLVFDDRINPLTTDKQGGGIYVDGARTLSELGAFPFVGESRGITFLEIQIGNALDPQRHKNNTPALRSALKSEIETFLRRGLSVQAYASDIEEEAFTVDASDALNPVSEQAAGRLRVKVGVATAKPAEFIFVEFGPK
jgi:uncharacterized protein